MSCIASYREPSLLEAKGMMMFTHTLCLDRSQYLERRVLTAAKRRTLGHRTIAEHVLTETISSA